MSGIYDLLTEVQEMGNYPAEYWDKMMHRVPVTTVKDREKYILSHALEKRVLDIGCTGPMSLVMRKAAAEYHGIDVVDNPSNIQNYYQVDIDRAAHLPRISDIDLIVAGEVIEHLSNAGHFLDLMREYNAPVILTTPNAYSRAGHENMTRRGIECVNREHVAWYSYHTLTVLVTRHGYEVMDWYWYNGKPLTAEGLIFYMRPTHGES